MTFTKKEPTIQDAVKNVTDDLEKRKKAEEAALASQVGKNKPLISEAEKGKEEEKKEEKGKEKDEESTRDQDVEPAKAQALGYDVIAQCMKMMQESAGYILSEGFKNFGRSYLLEGINKVGEIPGKIDGKIADYFDKTNEEYKNKLSQRERNRNSFKKYSQPEKTKKEPSTEPLPKQQILLEEQTNKQMDSVDNSSNTSSQSMKLK